MAEGGKSAKAVFKEVVPELTRILGREPPFTIVTASLNAKDLITDAELCAIRREGLTNDQRGNEVAEKLKEKIGDSEDPNACLLKICDVFESKTVDCPTLKDYGAKMRKSISTNGTPDGAEQLDAKDVDKILEVLDKVLFGAIKWNDLGLRLGLYQPRLNVISDGGGDAYRHLRKTIEAWLDGKDDARSRTWQTLIDAVRGTGNRAAAEKIPQKLKELYNITV